MSVDASIERHLASSRLSTFFVRIAPFLVSLNRDRVGQWNRFRCFHERTINFEEKFETDRSLRGKKVGSFVRFWVSKYTERQFKCNGLDEKNFEKIRSFSIFSNKKTQKRGAAGGIRVLPTGKEGKQTINYHSR